MRMLSGAWPDWRRGMSLRNGDSVRHGKNVYRVLLKDTGKSIVSTEAPVHRQGAWTDRAGLIFYHSQSDGAASATVRNVVFRSLRFQENRNSFKAAWDFCPVNRAIHPETPKERIPIIEVTIRNVTASGVKPFVQGNASFRMGLEHVACRGPFVAIKGSRDANCSMTVLDASLAKNRGMAEEPDIVFDGSGTLNLTLDNVTQDRDLRLLIGKNAHARISGSASLASLDGLSPVKGDSIKVGNIRRTYNGSMWELDARSGGQTSQSQPVAAMPPSPIGAASTAEWQWSVPVEAVISGETSDHPRAFLWVPPDCRRLRAVVVCQHNMEEEPILEHPKFRAALGQLGIAEVWVTPAFSFPFRFDQGAGEQFDAMMASLARESGYGELKFVPVVPLGHSAAASYPWNFAAWNPGRTLAAISVSGQWPFWKDDSQPPWGSRTIDGVPGLVTMGEYEAAESRGRGPEAACGTSAVAAQHARRTGGGHFDVSDAKVEFLALYLRKAVQYRLPADVPLDRPSELVSIDPTKTGCLVDRWRRNAPPRAPGYPRGGSAAVGSYTGDAREAFWCFDAEMAQAIDRVGARDRGKQADLLGYVQDGTVVPQDPKTHQQVTLQFSPQDDGMTFKLSATFLDAVPTGRPESWTGLKAGSPVGHAQDAAAIVIERICGPVEKLSDDTFAIRFCRMGMNNKKRSGEIWLVATHPGDARFRRAVQQSVLHFPRRNEHGADQHITFPPISNVKEAPKTVQLHATSDANVPAYYYVVAGPAVVEGDRLRLTAIPPRARFPVKLTVVAWQWGRSIAPPLKSADPVERSFFIEKR